MRLRWSVPCACVLLLVVTACGVPQSTTPTPTSRTARVVLVGDLMVGRGMTAALQADPGAVFAGVRHVLSNADVAAANLESPLTYRPHTAGHVNDLSAPPDLADEVAAAGFDVLGVANNHALDSGSFGLDDTITALGGAGLLVVGRILDPLSTTSVGGIDIAWLAFDATGSRPSGGPVLAWDDASATLLIGRAAEAADVVIVGVHGGVEYHPVPNRQMLDIAAVAVAAGADVVWGHGAHVVQPVTTVETADGRTTVVATSLGNFLFDQSGVERTTGMMLELLADSTGIVAFRTATTSHPDRIIRFEHWDAPGNPAVFWGGHWWTATRTARAVPRGAADTAAFPFGEVVAADQGDITGDGLAETVVSFRRPFQPTALTELRPDVQWQDADGRSAHVGVYTASFDEVWVAGTVVRPVAAMAVCDTAMAVAYSALDDPETIASGAWTWNGFGFDVADLEGAGMIGCTDIDGDGLTEPFADRS